MFEFRLKNSRLLKALEKFLNCKQQSLKIAFWHCCCFWRLWIKNKLMMSVCQMFVITFCVSRRCEIYSGHGHLCVCLSVCLSVPRRIPALLHGPGCNLGEWPGVPSRCALLGSFAICDNSLNAKCERLLVLALCLVTVLMDMSLLFQRLVAVSLVIKFVLHSDNNKWSRPSVCLPVCPLPHSCTTTWTRM